MKTGENIQLLKHFNDPSGRHVMLLQSSIHKFVRKHNSPRQSYIVNSSREKRGWEVSSILLSSSQSSIRSDWRGVQKSCSGTEVSPDTLEIWADLSAVRLLLILSKWLCMKLFSLDLQLATITATFWVDCKISLCKHFRFSIHTCMFLQENYTNMVFSVWTTTFFWWVVNLIETKIEPPKLNRKYTNGY